MEWTLLTRDDYITTNWSGGTTTQLAIAPDGAQYSNRDFLWRISSAKVETDHSDFTPLSDYNRFLVVLSGALTLKVGKNARAALPTLTVLPFDGGVPTESWGRCTDFNLMLRKDKCQGSVRCLKLPAGDVMTFYPEACDDHPHLTLAFFTVSGALTIPEHDLTAMPGELLLCRNAVPDAVNIAAQTRTEFIALSIHSK